MRLLFIVLAGQNVGYGHLNRCLSLAEGAIVQGLETAFIVLGVGADIIRKQRHSAIEVPWPGYVPAELFDGGIGQTIAIIDIAHPITFSNQSELIFLLQKARIFSDRVVLVDSLGDFSFTTNMPPISIDIVLIPYVGEGEIFGNSAAILAGPEYALLNPKYASMPIRQINEIAERVLVTFGGADPQELTLTVLEALNQIKKKLSLRVVIGPLFSKDLISSIKLLSEEQNHYVELLYSPLVLVEQMLWADIAVAASGLVKYELAATGTPAVIISINEVHDQANRPFARESLQRDLGVTTDPILIGQEINVLINSPAVRQKMAERGQCLVDGKGVERLIDILLCFES